MPPGPVNILNCLAPQDGQPDKCLPWCGVTDRRRPVTEEPLRWYREAQIATPIWIWKNPDLVVPGRDVGDSCIGEDLRVEW